MDDCKEHPFSLQDFREGETIADAAHHLARDPLDLIAELLDAELKPAFERAEKARAATLRAERKRARARQDRIVKAWERRGYVVTGCTPDETLTLAKAGAEDRADDSADVLTLANWRARRHAR